VHVADVGVGQVYHKVEEVVEIAGFGNFAFVAVNAGDALVLSVMFGSSYVVNNQTFEA